MRVLVLVVALAGCSKILGIDDLHGPGGGSDARTTDGTMQGDAMPDVPVSASIKIGGEVDQINQTSFQRMPVPNVAVELHRADSTFVTNAVTDANGQFTMTVLTNGMPINGYLSAKGAPIGAEDAYYYLRPLTADTTVKDFVLFSQQSINLLAQLCGVPAPGGNSALAIAFVVAADNTPRAGMVVQGSTTGPVRYMDAMGNNPDTSLTATSASGIAIVFDVKPTMQHFTAMQLGATGAYDLTPIPTTTNYIPIVVP